MQKEKPNLEYFSQIFPRDSVEYLKLSLQLSQMESCFRGLDEQFTNIYTRLIGLENNILKTKKNNGSIV